MTREERLEAALKEILKHKPKPDARDEIPEGEIVNDWAGGNIDDAYSLGVEHGSTSAYRHVAEIAEKALA